MSSGRIVRRDKGYSDSINGYRKYNDPPVLLPSGYYNTQGYACLKRCWIGFRISKAKGNHEKMVWYAKGIQRVQRELGLVVSSFPDLFELGAAARSEEQKEQIDDQSNHCLHG